MIRQPVVLEYKIPVEKVDAYIPAIYRNLDYFTKKVGENLMLKQIGQIW